MDRTEGQPLTPIREAIAVMAKQPVPGRVKTRLCPPLSHQEAADLYAAFLADTLSLVAETRAKGFIAYDPDGAGAFFNDLASPGMECIPQGDGDLGARLAGVSKRLFSIGFSKVLILASDAPGIPLEHLSLAFALLDDTDLVLGPGYDGGYSLIGTRRHVPALFSGIPWSTSQVLSRTLEQAAGEGMTCTLLPSCPDIDTVRDLYRLARDLEAGAGAGTPPGCPMTLRALASLGLVRTVPQSERGDGRPVDVSR
jgi:uncharacterized protein